VKVGLVLFEVVTDTHLSKHLYWCSAAELCEFTKRDISICTLTR